MGWNALPGEIFIGENRAYNSAFYLIARGPVIAIWMAAIGLVFYFLILRPSAQARKRHAELLGKLKRGDDVMTSGGLIGKVKDIKEVDTEGVKEVRVTVESGTATVVVERSRIVRVANSAVSSTPPT